MRKKQRSPLNLLTDPIPGLVIKIAVPASVGFLFNTMYNLVDTYFAAQWSKEALAALSLSFPIFIMILAIAQGVGQGTSTLIANSLGAKNDADAVNFQAQGLSLAVIINAVFVILLLPLLRNILQIFDASETVLQHAMEYNTLLVLGSIFFCMNFVLNAGLNARGLTKIYRNFLIVGFLANIALDPLLLYGLKIGTTTLIPQMGIRGIALATVAIQAGGSAYLFFRLIHCKGVSGCKPPSFIPIWKYMRQIIQQGFPAAINMATISVNAFIIVSYLSRFGTESVAAYGIGLRIEQIALLPTIGLNIALSSITGQNNGAGQVERIRQAYKTVLLMGFIIMIVVMGTVLLLNKYIVGIFTSDPDIITHSRQYLFTQALTFYAYVLLFQCGAVLLGIKQPTITMWIAIARQVLIPLAIFPLFAYTFGWDVMGIWFGIVCINWLAALATALVTQRKLNRLGRA